MKKVLFVIVSLFILTSVSAQPGQGGNRPQRTPEEMAKRDTERMTTALNLTAEQVAPVDSINLVFAKAQAKLIENANGDFASVREDMQKLNALRVEAFGKVLTDEQLDAYKKMMADRMRNRGEGRGNRPNGN